MEIDKDYIKPAEVIKSKINKITKKKLWHKKLNDLSEYCLDRWCSDCIFGEEMNNKTSYYCTINTGNDPEEWEYDYYIIELIKILAPEELEEMIEYRIKRKG